MTRTNIPFKVDKIEIRYIEKRDDLEFPYIDSWDYKQDMLSEIFRKQILLVIKLLVALLQNGGENKKM
jgi:hypothetical protein